MAFSEFRLRTDKLFMEESFIILVHCFRYLSYCLLWVSLCKDLFNIVGHWKQLEGTNVSSLCNNHKFKFSVKEIVSCSIDEPTLDWGIISLQVVPSSPRCAPSWSTGWSMSTSSSRCSRRLSTSRSPSSTGSCRGPPRTFNGSRFSSSACRPCSSPPSTRRCTRLKLVSCY